MSEITCALIPERRITIITAEEKKSRVRGIIKARGEIEIINVYNILMIN